MTVTRERFALWGATAYGAFVLVAVAPGLLFSWQVHEPFLMRVAGCAYTLTLLPAALIGFFARRLSGVWMALVGGLALIALWQSEILRYQSSGGFFSLIFGLGWWAFVAAIPALFGFLLISQRKERSQCSKLISPIE